MTSKCAIVTGAASGIGLACAMRLLKDGWNVATLDIATDHLHEQYADVNAAFPIHVNVECAQSCQDAVQEAATKLKRVDALLHFAGIWTGTSWEDSTIAEWQKILAINLTGSFLLAQAVAKHMKPAGQGSIVLTASAAARVGGVAAGPAYSSSKGGVISLTRSLARALGTHGIRVNAINPGMVESPMSASFSQDLIQQTISRTPLGRIARPDDIGDVACFLASDDSRFVSGEILEVNGGFYFD